MIEEKLGRKQSAQKYFEKSDKLAGVAPKKEEFKKPNLQSQLNAEKSQTKWNVIKNIFGSKSGWSEFAGFVKTKLKKES